MSHVAPVVVDVRGVSKRFVVRKEKSLKERLVNFGRSRRHREDFWALRDVSLEIYAGSTIGLIGPNGSGKSTLLKTIGGIIQPSSGHVLRRGRLAALLELGAGFHPDLTGRENVYLNAAILGLSREETDGHFDQIVEFSGIGDFIDTQVKFYSSGMYVRLAFAVAVHVDPDVLIVDEVLAVGDEPFQRKCLDRIRQFQEAGKTIILVTHSLGQVADLCTRAVVLERGHVVFDGDPADAILRLREDFEAARAAPSMRSATSMVPQVDIRGVDERGVMEGDDLGVSVEVDGVLPTDDVVIGMLIQTPLQVHVWGTNTQLLNMHLVSRSGRVQVNFDLSDLRLAPGRYELDIAVGTRADGELHRDPQAASFTVPGRMAGIGVLSPAVEVTSSL